MKILHIITSLKIGGAESSLCNLLTRCSKDLHLVVFFHDGPNRNRLNDLEIKTYHIQGLVSCYDPLAIFRLNKIIKMEKPDIIHTALWSSNIIGRLLGKFYNIPVVSDIHGDINDTGKFRRFTEIITAPLASKIVSVSNSVAQEFNKAALEILDKREFVQLQPKHTIIFNGIDKTHIIEKALTNKLYRFEIGLKEKDFVIGAIGRLEKIKAYEILIKAFKELINICKKQNDSIENIKLIIVGDGSQRNYLERLSANLNLENNISFLGFKTDAYKFYPLFDCFAISSISEGLSIALLEAMSFGLPIITTIKNSNDFHDVIRPGINGFLINSGDYVHFGEKLHFLYKNPQIRVSMSQKNIKLVEEKFPISNQIYQYSDIYQEILKKSKVTSDS